MRLYGEREKIVTRPAASTAGAPAASTAGAGLSFWCNKWGKAGGRGMGKKHVFLHVLDYLFPIFMVKEQ